MSTLNLPQSLTAREACKLLGMTWACWRQIPQHRLPRLVSGNWRDPNANYDTESLLAIHRRDKKAARSRRVFRERRPGNEIEAAHMYVVPGMDKGAHSKPAPQPRPDPVAIIPECSPELAARLSAAHDLKKRGEKCEVALLYLLMEIEPLRALWGHRFARWETLLSEEGLCSPTRYQKFKVASRYFSASDFGAYGLSTCLLVATVRRAHQPAVIHRIKEIWEASRKPLTFSQTVGIIESIDPTYAQQNLSQSVRSMKDHIRRLEGILLNRGVTPPPMEGEAPVISEEAKTPIAVALDLIRAKVRFKAFYPTLADEDLLRVASGFVESASTALRPIQKNNHKLNQVLSGAPEPVDPMVSYKLKSPEGYMSIGEGAVKILKERQEPIDVVGLLHSFDFRKWDIEPTPTHRLSILAYMRRELKADPRIAPMPGSPKNRQYFNLKGGVSNLR